MAQSGLAIRGRVRLSCSQLHLQTLSLEAASAGMVHPGGCPACQLAWPEAASEASLLRRSALSFPLGEGTGLGPWWCHPGSGDPGAASLLGWGVAKGAVLPPAGLFWGIFLVVLMFGELEHLRGGG